MARKRISNATTAAFARSDPDWDYVRLGRLDHLPGMVRLPKNSVKVFIGAFCKIRSRGRFFWPAKAMFGGDYPTAKTLVNGNTWI